MQKNARRPATPPVLVLDMMSTGKTKIAGMLRKKYPGRKIHYVTIDYFEADPARPKSGDVTHEHRNTMLLPGWPEESIRRIRNALTGRKFDQIHIHMPPDATLSVFDERRDNGSLLACLAAHLKKGGTIEHSFQFDSHFIGKQLGMTCWHTGLGGGWVMPGLAELRRHNLTILKQAAEAAGLKVAEYAIRRTYPGLPYVPWITEEKPGSKADAEKATALLEEFNRAEKKSCRGKAWKPAPIPEKEKAALAPFIRREKHENIEELLKTCSNCTYYAQHFVRLVKK